MLRKMADSVWLWPSRNIAEQKAIRQELVPISSDAWECIIRQAWHSPHSPLIVEANHGSFWAIGKDGQFHQLECGDQVRFQSAQPASDSDDDTATDPVEQARRQVLSYYRRQMRK